jgi:LacI family transcriptional regulator
VPTIRDVALRAGTSKSAVSRVMNGQRGVAPHIRERVIAAVEELGYRPNQQARSLRTSRTKVLGLLLPTLALPVIPEILQGTATAAHQLGYLMAISDAHDDLDLWHAYVQDLVARRVDGILCYDSGDIDEVLAPALEAEVPTMLLNRASHPSSPTLRFEIDGPFRELVDHLVDEGHRRIAVITPRARGVGADLVREALASHNLELDARNVQWADDPAQARRSVDRVMEGERPTAVIVSGAYNASAIASQLRVRGLRVPDDVSLVSIGESDWTLHGDPPVNAVHFPFREGAAAAVKLLIRHIEGDESAPRNLTMSASYMRRDSVGAAPQL